MEPTMALSERMKALQTAMDSYGQTSIDHFRRIHAFGDEIIDGLCGYLGEGANVKGVPPQGDWELGDYHGEKFSDFHHRIIGIGPVDMGVAIGIPHLRDEGVLWLRIVVTIGIEENEFSVGIADEPFIRGIPFDYRVTDLERVHRSIFEYVKRIFENPVLAATAGLRGKIGFLG